LATTTSTQDTGLLDVLVPAFEKASGYQVKTIAVGTGAALAMGERGDADVLLVHAPAAEEAYMAKERGLSRALVITTRSSSSDPRAIRHTSRARLRHRTRSRRSRADRHRSYRAAMTPARTSRNLPSGKLRR
jgi:ABC-type tungstate transport system permease subunit